MCSANICSAATCNDLVANGSETDKDCGGSCTPCSPQRACKVDKDCTSKRCFENSCAQPSCLDKIQNGDETALDCGGSCGPCAIGIACSADSQCATKHCFYGRCATELPTFAGPRVYDTGLGPIGLLSGDLNGDGKDDIIGINRGDASVGVLLNQGGTFAPAQQYFLIAAYDPLYGALSDLDGDGDLDVIVTSEDTKPSFGTPGAIAVLLNDGKGKLTLDDEYITKKRALSLSVVDLDNDGKRDLVFATQGNIGICWGTGQAKFDKPVYMAQTSVGDIVVDDFLGDSKPEIAVTSNENITVYANTGGRTFQAVATTTPAYILSARKVGDINGDHHADLLVSGDGDSEYQFAWGDGAGHFTHGTTISHLGEGNRSVTVADIDGDGDADLSVISGYKVEIWENLGTGNFNLRQSFTADKNSRSMAFGNFDSKPGMDLAISHDGYFPDLFTDWVTIGANVAVFMNVAGQIATTPGVDFGYSPFGIAKADFDGDGDLDLAATDFQSGNSFATSAVNVFLLDHGAFGGSASYPTGDSGPIALVAVDVDFDGDFDLVSGNQIGNSLTVFINDGKGRFTPRPKIDVFDATDIAVSAGGILTVGSLSSGVSKLSPTGGGAYSTPVFTSLYYNGSERVLYGSLNGAQAFVATFYGNDNDPPGHVGVMDTNFKWLQLLTTGDNPTAAAIGDFDGDGVGDLAAINGEGSDVAEYLSKSGSLQRNGSYGLLFHPDDALVTDLNQDGRADLVVGSYDGNAVSFMLSTGAGGFLPGVHYRVGSGINRMTLADFDGDGRLDVAAASDVGVHLLRGSAP